MDVYLVCHVTTVTDCLTHPLSLMGLERQFIVKTVMQHFMAIGHDPSQEDLLIILKSKLKRTILINVKDVKAKYLKQKNFQPVSEHFIFRASDVISVTQAFI